MKRTGTAAYRWAEEEFGGAELGDRRRRDRLVLMAAAAREEPDGRVSEVFSDAGELHGAYDFLESAHVSSAELTATLGRATAKRCRALPYVYVAIDGSSLQLTDRQREKGFGTIGASSVGAHGLKVISALAIEPNGATQGLLAQIWWSRVLQAPKTVSQRRKLRVEEKETQRWLEAIQGSAQRCDEQHVKPWFVLDREGDAQPILLALHETKHPFTVRANWDRVVQATGQDQQYLRATLSQQEPWGSYMLEVPGRAKREKRIARMVVRAMPLMVRLPDRRRRAKKPTWLALTAVWVREEGTTPAGEAPLDWLLYTNQDVDDEAGARRIVEGYALRWRIEDFHKTWKTGACNTERLQLRSVEAAKKWATILAAVATRIERIKHLARNTPDEPAAVELSRDELRVLVALAPTYKKRAESAPTVTLSIAQATYWIARLGGYTGKSSGGPPGAITLRRGLEKLRAAVAGVLAVEALRD